MKKIGLLTLNGYFNYGNRLQNYALQEVLKDLNFSVDTILNYDANYRKKSVETSKIEKIKKLKNKSAYEIFKLVNKKIENKLYSDLRQQRTEVFKSFSLQYINETEFSITEDNIPDDLAERYDYFVTGSDQVWNPNFRMGSPIDFLTFAPPEKRISYAASFGVSEIPEEYIDDYRKWLSEMAHLSVREEAGAKIIKDLTGREATVSLDPTMLLTKEKWLSISKVATDKPMTGYLLTYFLGEIPKERVQQLKDIAKRNDLEIVNLAQIKDKTAYLSGPSEFIDYINSASVFCTDSFHGAVFSILLNTPFIVFNREEKKLPSMNSRIETLLKTFKLESRHDINIESNSQIFDIDFSHTEPILESERRKSFDYLKLALNLKK